MSEQKLPYDISNLTKSVREEQESEISLDRSETDSVSSRSSSSSSSSASQGHDGKGQGMYKIDKESFNKHRLSIIRNEEYAVVRKESFNELERCSDLESHTHRSVASRVFKNHDIATARASHASAIAEVKLQEAEK